MKNQFLSDETIIEQFELFQSGKMSATLRDQFSEKLKADSDLQQAYQIFLLSHEVIEQKISQDLKSQFSQWNSETIQTVQSSGKVISLNPASARRGSVFSKIAAAASILLIASFSFIKFNQVKSYPDTAINKIQKFELVAVRGENKVSKVDLILQDLIDKKKSEDQTIAALQSITFEEPELGYYKAQNSLAKLYLTQGNCSSMTDAYQKSAQITSYQFDGDIGKVLCALKNNAKTEEIELLLKPILVNTTHYYYESAKDIESQIHSVWWKLFN